MKSGRPAESQSLGTLALFDATLIMSVQLRMLYLCRD